MSYSQTVGEFGKSELSFTDDLTLTLHRVCTKKDQQVKRAEISAEACRPEHFSHCSPPAYKSFIILLQ